MKISLQDTYFCVTGNFETFKNRGAVESALKRGGAKITKSMGLKTQVLAFGSGYTQKTEVARDRGLPVIREPDLLKLIEHGEVEVEFESAQEKAQGEKSLDALLGEVRGVLGLAPSRKMWSQLVELVDACSQEQLEPLVAYIEDHTGRWSEREQRLCVAPKHWLANMGTGLDSPAYRLVRHLNLDELNIKTTSLKNMLGCESLVNVQRLNLAVSKALTKTAFAALGKSQRFVELKHLALGHFEADWVRSLDAGGALSSLRTLQLYPSDCWRVDVEHYEALFGLAMCAHVEKLIFTRRSGWGSQQARVWDLLKDEALLPSLEHFEVDSLRHGDSLTSNPSTADTIAWVIGHRSSEGSISPANHRVKTFTSTTPVQGYYSSDLPQFDFSVLPNLETLRFYIMRELQPRRERDEERFFIELERALPVHEMTLPGSLERILTNAPLDKGPFAELARLRPDVELVSDPLPEPLFALV